ncbi:hypothetical protein [Spelaeicoccus albus]|uniref:hypothetical protein n=1 Tax=Spelaeicoccus albus TaxID=1280376 RepID=UPI0015CE98A8|nr:hypothetical protein [Spelaeicoccus albus]
MHEKRKVGRPAMITLDQIADAAILELDGITSTKVAERLGVGQSSLYRHITRSDDLARLAVDKALDAHQWPAKEGAWRDFLERTADAFLDFLTQYPGSCRALLELNPSPTALVNIATITAEYVVKQGLSPREANVAVNLISVICLDTVDRLDKNEQPMPDGQGKMIAAQQRKWESQANHELREDMQQLLHAKARTWMHERFDIVLDGLAGRLEKRAV